MRPSLRSSLALLGVAGVTVATVVTMTTGAATGATGTTPRAADRAADRGDGARLTSLAVPTAPARRVSGHWSRIANLHRTGTAEYGLIGVSWAGEQSGKVRVDVRVRKHGHWTRWQRLDVDPDGGQDAASGQARGGTEPLWVGRANGVAARLSVRGRAVPADLKVDLVDPGSTPPGAAATPAQRAVPSTAALSGFKKKKKGASGPAFTPRPAIFARDAWGAAPAKPCDSPVYSSQMLGVTVHHTAGANGYSAAESPAIVRAIQSYHINGRGWCDVGYDFLVDKYGQIFEGRAGGMSGYLVRGAHAGNFDVNASSLGVSMMGNFQTAKLTPVLKSAMVQLVGWSLATHYLPAKGKFALDGHSLKRIHGHRDVAKAGFRPSTSTSCPGRYGYQWLNAKKKGLRKKVANYTGNYNTAIKAYYYALGSAVVGMPQAGEAPIGTGYVTRFTGGDIYSSAVGTHFVNGQVQYAYDVRGGALGALGFPTSDVVTTGTVSTATFERGRITYDAATGQTTVG